MIIKAVSTVLAISVALACLLSLSIRHTMIRLIVLPKIMRMPKSICLLKCNKQDQEYKQDVTVKNVCNHILSNIYTIVAPI